MQSPRPERIGPFRILGVLGEGGMGVVYEAEQDEPRRVVALKVIRAGIATDEILGRFERESQVLARLEHPGIARIYEAGTADAGFGPQPYVAMELVRGRPITSYAMVNVLDPEARLELVARVCDAADYAHHQGVVHRDLKPQNILVDRLGQPKIVDFGVARVTGGGVRVRTQTEYGELIGTLPYMSPEQIMGDSSEVDARSDVYSLGVVLYQVLTGELPFDVESKTIPDAARTIRHDDPVPLSALNRLFRGDVEIIAAKALEKDKRRRYASASAMADDIRRHLRDQPIVARPASVGYLAFKFVRRHRMIAGVLAAVFVTMALGAAVFARQAVRATRAEARAVREMTKADSVHRFFRTTLGSMSARGSEPTVRELLDGAAARVDAGELARDPDVEAAVRATLGAAYRALGDEAKAREQTDRARRAGKGASR